jgi:hypothetical protein
MKDDRIKGIETKGLANEKGFIEMKKIILVVVL